MRLKGIILIVFALLSMASYAQITQTVRGQIIDQDSKTTLPGAHVVVLGTEPLKGTITDTEGNFRIDNVPVGRYDLKVSFLGYKEMIIPNIMVGSGKEIVSPIEMSESVIMMKAVEINGKKRKGDVINKMASASARSFTVEETERYAGSFNDPARMAMSYAGVMPNGEGGNDLVIRGNSPQGLLWQLEGIDIPNPNHFGGEGATGGPISILNSTTLANSDFFTGAFPSEYGNAFSGVFDIRLRNGNNEKREYTIQAGLMGLDVAAEGPFSAGSQGSYLLNYRYSTLSLLKTLGIKVVGDAVPEFQDLTFKVNVPTRKAGVFSIFGIGGLSKISFDKRTEEDVQFSYADVKRDMAAFGISNRYPFNKKTYLLSVVSAAGTRNSYDEYAKYNNIDFDLVDRDRFRGYNLSARTTLNHKFNAKHFLKTGIYYKNIRYDLLSKMWDDRQEGLIEEIRDKGDSYVGQSFASWRYRITDKLTLNSGLHAMYFGLNEHYSVEPRVGIKWQFTPAQSISAGYGKHSKMESLSTYLANTENEQGLPVQYNKYLDFVKAHHYVLGYDNRITEDLNLKLELYYQDLYNVPIDASDTGVYSMLNQYSWFTRRDLVNKGDGYNYGLELTLEKYFSNSYYFLVTGSLFDSKYKAGDGKWRNTAFNSRYVFNILGGKEFRLGKVEKHRTLAISTKASWAGGHWYTPVHLEESRKRKYTVLDESEYLTLQAKDFVRIDLQVSVRRERPKSTHVIEMDIQNVTNAQNPAGMYYNIMEDKVDEWYSTGIIPTLSYRIEF